MQILDLASTDKTGRPPSNQTDFENLTCSCGACGAANNIHRELNFEQNLYSLHILFGRASK